MGQKKSSPLINGASVSGFGWLVWFLPFFYIAVVTYLTPLRADDFATANMYYDYGYQPGHFFYPRMIWDFYIDNYYHWGSRLGYIFVTIPLDSFWRTPFDYFWAALIAGVLNGLVFTFFTWLIFIFCFGRRPSISSVDDQRRWFFIFAGAMLILARKGETIFWANGYSMYSWPATLLFAFLVFYRLLMSDNDRFVFSQNIIKKYIFILFIAILGFLGGMTMEFAALVTLLVLLLLIAYKIFIARKKLPLWAYVGVTTFIVGFLVMMTAPGQWERFKHSDDQNIFHLSDILHRLSYLPDRFHHFIVKTRFMPFVVLLVLYGWGKEIKTRAAMPWWKGLWQKMQKDKDFGVAVFFFVASIGFVMANIYNTFFSWRALYFGSALLLVSLVLSAEFVFVKSKNILSARYKKIALRLVMCLAVVHWAAYGYFTYRYHVAFEQRVASIKQQKENGKTDVVVPPFRFNTAYWVSGDINTDWVADLVARYYGVRKISLQ
ncbi:MAG: DUF6056 family protein [Hydrotalea sp.]|nr:DUF6056 family protein [Hydrotalea sp.]